MEETERARRARPHHVAIPAAILAALWLTMLTVGAGPVDGQLLAAVYAGGSPMMVAIARGFTFLGEPEVVLGVSIVMAAWLAYEHHWRRATAVFFVTLIGRALVTAQKYGIERLRPEEREHLVIVTNPSFPSGHAAGSMIVYLTLALVLASGTRWKWPAIAAALALAFAVGVSRNMLGVHWPSDVVGGWAFGLLWVLVALPVAERLTRE